MRKRLPGVAALQIGPAEQGLDAVVSDVLGLGLAQQGDGLVHLAAGQGGLGLPGQLVGALGPGDPAKGQQHGQEKDGQGGETSRHAAPSPRQRATASLMPATSSGENQRTSGSLRNQVNWRLA